MKRRQPRAYAATAPIAVVTARRALGSRVRPLAQLPESSAFAAYSRIKRLILDNELGPGAQVLEQTLADRFGLSRTPVREASLRLAQEGLIEVVPRHGIRVLPLSPDDMREIYEVLTALEPVAAEMLARRKPSRDELAPLFDACDAMEQALLADDLAQWAKADARFHSALVSLCGNRRLATMVSGVWEQSHRARMFTLRLRARPTQSTREHREIAEVILSGDAARVREQFRVHRESIARNMLKLIEDYGLSHL